MDPGEILGSTAQVAVALAGFAGVVVSFRPGTTRDWSAVDRFRLRLLLGNSVLPLILCLTGMVLLAITPPISGLWRWASGLAVLALFPYGFYMRAASGQIPREQFPADLFTKWVFYPLAALAWLFTFLQVYNAIFLGAFWPFFAMIAFQVVAAVIQFVRLILLPHESG